VGNPVISKGRSIPFLIAGEVRIRAPAVKFSESSSMRRSSRGPRNPPQRGLSCWRADSADWPRRNWRRRFAAFESFLIPGEDCADTTQER